MRNIFKILKEKKNIIDGMLLIIKQRKKIVNEINIYDNKLFSDYLYLDNNKSKIPKKLKLIREQITQRKFTYYLNKKITVESKEEKLQQNISQLSTEQLESFNKELLDNQVINGKEKENIELMKKQYEDII